VEKWSLRLAIYVHIYTVQEKCIIWKLTVKSAIFKFPNQNSYG
jgi:hypothetical protein